MKIPFSGLPEPSKNHAVLMGRFAMECLKKMKEKVRELELTLGPGTADLDLRVGLHSGPVRIPKKYATRQQSNDFDVSSSHIYFHHLFS
jgi:hypothetical protein